jgi:hypothetical protein
MRALRAAQAEDLEREEAEVLEKGAEGEEDGE